MKSADNPNSPENLALLKAKMALMRKADSQFFSYISFSVKYIWDQEVNPLKVDGMTIRLNPDYFVNLGKDERVFMLLHACMGIAYMHQLRIGNRDLESWNKASNAVIDNQLIDHGFAPPNGISKQDRFNGMSAEEIYPIILQEAMQRQQQQQNGNGKGGSKNQGQDQPHPFGNDIQPPSQDKQDNDDGDGNNSGNSNSNNPSDQQSDGDSSGMSQQDLENQIKDMLMSASMASKMANEKPGSVPGSLELMLEKLMNPRLRPEVILRRYVTQLAKNEYSYIRPKKQFFPEFYLPTLRGEKLMNISIAADLSGSTSDEEVNIMISESANILKIMKPDEINFFTFDTQIMDRYKLKSMADIRKLKLHGRGGTDINPVIQEAIDTRAQVLVIFSDGQFYPPKIKPKCPVLWLIYNNPTFTAPYGKVIHYKV